LSGFAVDGNAMSHAPAWMFSHRRRASGGYIVPGGDSGQYPEMAAKIPLQKSRIGFMIERGGGGDFLCIAVPAR
jgi:hypothetical protein